MTHLTQIKLLIVVIALIDIHVSVTDFTAIGLSLFVFIILMVKICKRER